jgi:23S rRNA (cytidine2498-2'-O)-methyltransferase
VTRIDPPTPADPSARTWLVCRPGFSQALAEEVRDSGMPARVLGDAALELSAPARPAAPFVFERQRLPSVRPLHLEPGQPLPAETIEAVVAALHACPGLWTQHAFALPDDAEGLAARANGLTREVERRVDRADPALAKRRVTPERLARRGEGTVLQWLLTPEALAWSVAPLSALSETRPGGVYRMRLDPEAPSRSYLKIEEAFARLGEEPQAGQWAVDLGAAPGGWTTAVARRGCAVIAVDNGPLRLPPHLPGRVEHRQEDGLRFAPALSGPVDWLLGDMLIPPGDALGLLRRWLDPARARRVIVNVKLPQAEPWAALRPLAAFLRGRSDWEVAIRQLYHDRREVTVMARACTD